MLDEGTVKDSFKVAHYFDQACKIVIRPCSQDELLVMRGRWTKLMWTVPSRVQAMSDSQLSVLRRLLDRGHNMLASDLRIWGPFSERRDRAVTMVTTRMRAGPGSPGRYPGRRAWATGWRLGSS